MKPYYGDDAVTIYHADCLEVLPSLSADVVLTDPPYGVNVDYDQWDDTPENLGRLIADAMPMMTNSAPLVAMTTGVRNLFMWPPPTWVLCWFDPGGTGCNPWGFSTWQPVCVYGKDPYLAAGLGSRPDGKSFMLGRRPNAEDKDGSGQHPCPKPLDVGSWLVDRLAPPGDRLTFLDPFMGSGTFVRSARDHGHRVIGIELSERYCEIAASRLAQGVLDLAS